MTGTPLSLDSDAADDDNDPGGGRFSLAHELAAAMMPEPSSGSRMLAEEFGIEFEDGAEGMEEVEEEDEEEELETPQDSFEQPLPVVVEAEPIAPAPPLDPWTVLSKDIESTDVFLSHLRRLDGDQTSQSSDPQLPNLERIATDVIRRMNQTVRNRESQVRELLECEREFRRISGEVGGNDILGELDELEVVELVTNAHDSKSSQPPTPGHSRLNSIVEKEEEEDWENPTRFEDPGLGSRQSNLHESVAPEKSDIPPPPPSIRGLPSPSATLPHVADLRTLTKSLVNSLTAISEQAQVNGAATAEAGRKIRALKNKLGGWQTDWESAERSRERIEHWESPLEVSRRIDGRILAAEQVEAFRLALQEAATKTAAIMATS